MNKKDYLYAFANPTDTNFMANIKWPDSGAAYATRIGRRVMIDYTSEWAAGSRGDFITMSHVNATTGNQATYDSAKDSGATEWSSDISVSRSIPDPTTLVFFGLGLAGIGIVRWKKVFARKIIFKSIL